MALSKDDQFLSDDIKGKLSEAKTLGRLTIDASTYKEIVNIQEELTGFSVVVKNVPPQWVDPKSKVGPAEDKELRYDMSGAPGEGTLMLRIVTGEPAEVQEGKLKEKADKIKANIGKAHTISGNAIDAASLEVVYTLYQSPLGFFVKVLQVAPEMTGGEKAEDVIIFYNLDGKPVAANQRLQIILK